MRGFILATVLLSLASAAMGRSLAQGNIVSSDASVTMCELYKNPQHYAGKTVKFRAKVVGQDLKALSLYAPTVPTGCDEYIHISVVFPEDASPAPSFDLLPDESFLKFRSAIRSMEVIATFEGLFDLKVAETNHEHRRRKYDGRVIVHRISRATAVPFLIL
jgi:hypothetical protein